MKSYFAYTRVSTVKQGERGSSLQEQKSAIEAYAARNDLRIVGWFEEMVTAAKLGRRVFNQMLAELEKGDADGIIIHKIDRSARNLRDWARIGELIDRGIDVRFAHESFDLASRGGRLAADIQAVVAADYVRNLRQEVEKGVYGRLKEGLYPFPAPIGYVNTGKGRAKTIDPETGPLIREAFELYGRGRHSLNELRQEMFRRGLRQKNGKPISRSGIATILHNQFYLGIIRIARTGETFQGIHDAITTKALFDRVQDILSGRRVVRTTRHDYPFRCLIECKGCGRSLVGERQKGRIYYRCHTRTCRGTSLREADVEAAYRDLYQRLAFSQDELEELGRLVEEGRATAVQVAQVKRDQLRMSIGRCDDRLTRLTDAFLDASIDKGTFEDRKSGLLMERKGLLDTLNRPDERDTFAELKKKLELGSNAYLRFDSEFPAEKREIVELTTSNLVVEGKRLAIRLRFPFEGVAKWRPVFAGGPRRATTRTSECKKRLRVLFKSLTSLKSSTVLVASTSTGTPRRSQASHPC